MIVVVGLIVAFVLVLIFANRETRDCRWREDRTGDRDGQKKFRCMACGAEAFTTTGKPPLDCRAKTKDRR
ncbi:hypothetical protein [Roseovarius salinarum]|uniref:hypothetical protein n=1 Tax=Roseovarius salinarum TaxID=1981892 RepID=UPI000C343D85|nr:hypothetical protein [Roseovarius salinarum]